MSSASQSDPAAPVYPAQNIENYQGLSAESISLVSDIGVLEAHDDRDRVIASNFSEVAFKSAGAPVDIRVINGNQGEALDLCSSAYLRLVIRNNSATLDTAITAASQLIEDYSISVGGKTYYTVSGDHLMHSMRELTIDELRIVEKYAGLTHSVTGTTSSSDSNGGVIEFYTGLTDYLNPTTATPSLLLGSTALTASDLIGTLIRVDNPALATSGFQRIQVPQSANSGFIPRGGQITYLIKLCPFPHWDRKVALKHVTQDVTIRIRFKTGLEVFQDQCKQTFGGPANASLHANNQLITLAELEVIKVGQKLEGRAYEKLYRERFGAYNVHCRGLSYLIQPKLFTLPANPTVITEVTFNNFQGLFKSLHFIVRPVRNGSSDQRLQLCKSYNANGQLTAVADRSAFRLDDVELIITGNNSFFSSGNDDDDTARVIANLCNFKKGSVYGRSLVYTPFNFTAAEDVDSVGNRLGGGVRIAKDFKLRFTMPNRAALAALGFTAGDGMELTCLGYQYSDVIVMASGSCEVVNLTEL